ncbi:LysR substrate-binding domain-containing protein [Mesorhizobium sp. SB112]
MQRGRLPLTALRSFEVTGRLLSFSKAAEELFVSQAAISRQIRELETFIGSPLFERHHRRVSLTESGAYLLARLTRNFDDMDQCLSELRQASSNETIAVSVEPSFAGAWLVPRLNFFSLSNPSIDVSVIVDAKLVEFRTHEAELAIRHSATERFWPRTQARHLVDIAVSPVLSPKLLDNGPPLTEPADLRHYTLLHEENRNGWQRWFEAAGIPDGLPQRGPIFTDSALAAQAAALGHGVALGDRVLNQADLKAGRLVMPFDVEVDFGAYWLVASDFEKLSPGAKIFADWLITEIASA